MMENVATDLEISRSNEDKISAILSNLIVILRLDAVVTDKYDLKLPLFILLTPMHISCVTLVPLSKAICKHWHQLFDLFQHNSLSICGLAFQLFDSLDLPANIPDVTFSTSFLEKTMFFFLSVLESYSHNTATQMKRAKRLEYAKQLGKHNFLIPISFSFCFSGQSWDPFNVLLVSNTGILMGLYILYICQ